MNPNQQWTVDDQGHIRYAVKTNMAIVYDSKTSTVIIVYIDKNKELGLSAFSKWCLNPNDEIVSMANTNNVLSIESLKNSEKIRLKGRTSESTKWSIYPVKPVNASPASSAPAVSMDVTQQRAEEDLNRRLEDYREQVSAELRAEERGFLGGKEQVKALEDKFGFTCPDPKDKLSAPQFARFKGDIEYAMKNFSAPAVETPDHKLTDYGYKFISNLISSSTAFRPGESPMEMLNWAYGKNGQTVNKPDWKTKDYATYFAICFDRNLRGL